ncbi:MAG: regulatory protein RecX [Thermocrispum sp.]
MSAAGEGAPRRRRSGREKAGSAGSAGVPEGSVDPDRAAKTACLRLLAVKPRTRADLAKALARKGFEPEVAEPVLDRLERAGLIDDAGYAEMLVRSRYAYQGLGRRALKSQLLRQGVDGAVAEGAVGAIGADDEEARGRELVRKRLRAMSGVSQEAAIRRLVGMLARKGYPAGLAYRVVREELAAAGRETSLLDLPAPD